MLFIAMPAAGGWILDILQLYVSGYMHTDFV